MDALSHLAWQVGPYTLTLKPLRAGADAPRIYYVPELPRLLDDPGAPVYVIREWAEYGATVSWETPLKPPEGLWAGDEPAPRLQVGGYRIHYANRVGRSSLRVIAAEQEVGEPLHLEVVSPKLSLDPRDAGRWFFYPRFVRALVDDIAAASAAWPFAYRGATAFATRLAGGRPSALFYFHFRRRYDRQLADAFHTIVASPHRVLTFAEAVVPAIRATCLDASAVTWLAAHPGAWQPAPRPAARAAPGRLYIPARVWQALQEETHDTPENRFARRFAELLGEAIRQVLRSVPGVPLEEDGIRVLREALASAEQASCWPEVGPKNVLPVSSHVLLKSEGYRELYRLYPLFLFGRLPFSGDLGEAIANRDVATLYEWWCLFKLVEELGEICGPPAGEPWPATKEGGPQALQVRFTDGTVLRYQPSCRGGCGSCSLTMRPDFLVENPRRGRVCLDAKFSFRLAPGELGPDEEVDPERHPTHRDLMTMHAYRDVLQCRATVLLYPDDRQLFFGIDGRLREGLGIAGLLGEPAPEGVGAIPYRPGLQHEVV